MARTDLVRYQLFLPRALSERLEALAARARAYPSRRSSPKRWPPGSTARAPTSSTSVRAPARPYFEPARPDRAQRPDRARKPRSVRPLHADRQRAASRRRRGGSGDRPRPVRGLRRAGRPAARKRPAHFPCRRTDDERRRNPPSRRRAMLRTAMGPGDRRRARRPAGHRGHGQSRRRAPARPARRGPRRHRTSLEPAQVERIIRLVASHARTEVHADAPIVSAELPPHGDGLPASGSRACCRRSRPAPCFSIRKPAARIYTLADYVTTGS